MNQESDLDELYEEKRNLESRIENFFDNVYEKHTGDRNYQMLLEQLEDVEEQIREFDVE